MSRCYPPGGQAGLPYLRTREFILVRVAGAVGLATDRDHPFASAERDLRHPRAGPIERAEKGSVVEIYVKARSTILLAPRVGAPWSVA